MRFYKVGRFVGYSIGGGLNVPWLKAIIGVLGAGLPLILLFWGLAIDGNIQDSMSSYYALRTRDAFVGILFIIGWVLFVYKGYNNTGSVNIDSIAGNLACVFALGVAFFSNQDPGWMSKVHFISAACLFILFAVFSIFLFTRSKNTPPDFWKSVVWVLTGKSTKKDGYMSGRKILRNRIYLACGIIIMVMLLLLGMYMWLWQDTSLAKIKPVFILEWIMVWAFALSWLVKGEILFKDKVIVSKSV